MRKNVVSLMPWVVAVSSGLPGLAPGCDPACVEGLCEDPAGKVVEGDPSAPMGCLPPHCSLR